MFEKYVGWALGQRYMEEKPSQHGVVWNTDRQKYKEGLWTGNVSCMLHPLLFILLFLKNCLWIFGDYAVS